MLQSRKMDKASALKKKRKYGKLSLDQKVQIIRAAEMGYSQRTLASQYNCGKTQVHLLVAQKDLWLSKWERTRKGDRWSRYRGTPTVSEINSLVWDFYKKASSQDLQVSVSMLLERAKQVAQALNVLNFDADHEWFEKFKREFNIVLPPSPENLLPPCTISPNSDPLLSGFDKCNVFYLGVTELYHRTLPCVGQKSDEHITLCYCISAAGEKEIISLVFSDDACVEGELWNVSVPCFSSPMGQVTHEVYQHSLNVFNQKMNLLDKRVLLYVDENQFPSEIEKVMSNIEIRPWPWEFNVQAVINNYRLLYYQRLVTFLAASHLDDWSTLGDKVKNLAMSKVMRLMQSAWKLISAKLVELSFGHKSDEEDQDSLCEEINQKLSEEIKNLVLFLKLSSKSENTSSISEDLFSPVQPETDFKEDGVDTIPKEKLTVTDEEQEVTSPLLKSEMFPTILKMEMLLLSMPETAKRQNALEVLNSLEMALQDLVVAEKASDLNICGNTAAVGSSQIN